MSIVAKVFGGLLVLVVIVVGGAVIAASTIDIDKYRDQIAAKLSEQTGRTIKFNGPIHLALSWHGVGLAVENASIGNPSWATRPQMAEIGALQLGVELMPLLSHQLIISELDIKNADILLETGPNEQHNWDMKPAAGAQTASAPVAQTAAAPSSGETVMPQIEELSIINSQLAMRGADGKVSTFKVDKMTLAPSEGATAINGTASYNGTPIKIALKSNTRNLLDVGKFPYTADLTYGNYHLVAQGHADTRAKMVELNPYELTAGGSVLHGQLSASMGGAKPDIHGTVIGDKLDPADFKTPAGPESSDAAKAPAATASANQAGESKPLFSTAPLDVSALKSANAAIDLQIGEVVVSKGSLKQVVAKVALTNGTLELSPFKASLGDSVMQGDLKMESSTPPQYSLSFKAPGVDIATLLQMLGTEGFMTGKGDADIALSGSGNSLHDMASNTAGHIDILAANGTISAASAGNIASGLAQILAPGSGNPTLTCVAIRFNVTGGVAKDNGILADSSASTVAGSGGFSLRDETVNLSLSAKPKTVNTRGIVPAVLISGPLMSPKIGIDTANTVQNAAGALLNGGNNKIAGALGGLLGGGSASTQGGIPTLAAAPAGQNACAYTLDHKDAAAAAPSSSSGNSGVKDVVGQAGSKAKGMEQQLLKGLLGH